MLKMFSRHLQNVFKTSSSRRMFAGLMQNFGTTVINSMEINVCQLFIFTRVTPRFCERDVSGLGLACIVIVINMVKSIQPEPAYKYYYYINIITISPVFLHIISTLSVFLSTSVNIDFFLILIDKQEQIYHSRCSCYRNTQYFLSNF